MLESIEERSLTTRQDECQALIMLRAPTNDRVKNDRCEEYLDISVDLRLSSSRICAELCAYPLKLVLFDNKFKGTWLTSASATLRLPLSAADLQWGVLRTTCQKRW